MEEWEVSHNGKYRIYQEKRCYTVKELQEILGISRPTVYELLKKNEFRWIPDWNKVSYF